jgi:ribosomal protein S18 acetylase RimI-like enzyme
MKMSIEKWNELDFQEAAAVMYAARHAELQGRKSIESLVKQFLNWKYISPPVVVCARSDETLVGWVMLHITNPRVVELNPGPFGGHPLVVPGPNSERVKADLITEALTYATVQGFEKIDLTIEQEEGDELHRACSMYEAQGFRPFYFCMKCSLSEHQGSGVNTPAGIEICQVRKVEEDDLYHCYCDAFSGGEARFFHDQSEDERWEFFKELSPYDVMDEECSLVLMKDQQVIGFTYVLQYGGKDNSHLNLICIHPDVQGQGFGKTLLQLTMKKAAQQCKTMTLYTEADTSARALYHRCGFEKGGGTITYIYRISE